MPYTNNHQYKYTKYVFHQREQRKNRSAKRSKYKFVVCIPRGVQYSNGVGREKNITAWVVTYERCKGGSGLG